MNTFRNSNIVRTTAGLLLFGTLVVVMSLSAMPKPMALLAYGAQVAQAGSMEIYVDANYEGESSNGSIDSPYKTINEAANQVQPGGTVIIREGTYRETITMEKSGTAEAPITFTAYQDERVIISGAVEVEGWSDPDGDGTFEANVPVHIELGPESYQVFVDGQMVHQAREPEIADHNDPFSQRWLDMYKGKAVYLKTANGNYIKAVDGGGGDVEASAEVTNTDEEFYLLDIKGEELESGDVVSFLTYDTKHFLTPNDGGIAGNRPNNKLVATRATLTDDEVDWDKFEIEKVTDTSNETIHSGDFIALYDINKLIGILKHFLSGQEANEGKQLA